MSSLPNPHAPTKESLDNGRKYFQINCEVCHGRAGKGDGTAVQYGMPAPSLLTDITKNRTDGYIYGMIRNGRGLMPTYDRIEDMDRWDVVNYIRALQGKIPGVVADTSPAELRGTAYGFFNLLGGIAMLAASVIAGGLWDIAGPRGTFLAGAGFAVIALAGLLALRGKITGKGAG